MRSRIGFIAGFVCIAAFLAVGSAWAAETCSTDPCTEQGCAEGCWISALDMDSRAPLPAGADKAPPQHWAKMPIQYKVNLSSVTDAAEKAKFKAAIDAAFATWSKPNIPCSTLKFESAGETQSSLKGGEPGFIHIVIANDDSVVKINPYRLTTFAQPDNQAGEISYGYIVLNNTPEFQNKYKTKLGFEKKEGIIDVQTLITWLISNMIGMKVGQDTKTGTGTGEPYFSNFTARTLCANHKKVAAYSYKDDSKPECATPEKPLVCRGEGTVAPPDAGNSTVSDGGGSSSSDGSVTPVGDGSVTPVGDGGVISDAGLPPSGGGDDDGCCRVSHSRGESLPFLTLAGLAILLVLLRRRRS